MAWIELESTIQPTRCCHQQKRPRRRHHGFVNKFTMKLQMHMNKTTTHSSPEITSISQENVQHWLPPKNKLILLLLITALAAPRRARHTRTSTTCIIRKQSPVNGIRGRGRTRTRRFDTCWINERQLMEIHFLLSNGHWCSSSPSAGRASLLLVDVKWMDGTVKWKWNEGSTGGTLLWDLCNP